MQHITGNTSLINCVCAEFPNDRFDSIVYDMRLKQRGLIKARGNLTRQSQISCHFYTTQFVPWTRPKNVVSDRVVNKILSSPEELVIPS